MQSPLIVFAATLLATLGLVALVGGDRNWGYVVVGALMIAALTTALTALINAALRRRPGGGRTSSRG